MMTASGSAASMSVNQPLRVIATDSSVVISLPVRMMIEGLESLRSPRSTSARARSPVDLVVPHQSPAVQAQVQAHHRAQQLRLAPIVARERQNTTRNDFYSVCEIICLR